MLDSVGGTGGIVQKRTNLIKNHEMKIRQTSESEPLIEEDINNKY